MAFWRTLCATFACFRCSSRVVVVNEPEWSVRERLGEGYDLDVQFSLFRPINPTPLTPSSESAFEVVVPTRRIPELRQFRAMQMMDIRTWLASIEDLSEDSDGYEEWDAYFGPLENVPYLETHF